jgi:hypothetical protein
MRNMTRSVFPGIVALGLMALAPSAPAAVVTVHAQANSTSGGSGADTGMSFGSGQAFSVTAALTDLWSAGALPRWSNADGLTGDLLATGSDESGQPANTLIGASFGSLTLGGLAAPYGALVGRLGGAGNYFLIGTNFTGTAGQGGLGTGLLELFYFDSNNVDNTGSISATVNAVPIPAAGWLLVSGLVGFAALGRRRGGVTSQG